MSNFDNFSLGSPEVKLEQLSDAQKSFSAVSLEDRLAKDQEAEHDTLRVRANKLK
jgi:hypothetical protein